MAHSGRPKKKPDIDTKKELAMMIDQACSLAQVPFDDRRERDKRLPGIAQISYQMNLSTIKMKRLLISGNYYTSATSRAVQRLWGTKTIKEVCEELSVRPATVYSCIPYSKGAYNLKETSIQSDQNVRYRNRKKAVMALKSSLKNQGEWGENLWTAIKAFQEYPFIMMGSKTVDRTEHRTRFHYSIEEDNSTGQIYQGIEIKEHWTKGISSERRIRINRTTIEEELIKAQKEQERYSCRCTEQIPENQRVAIYLYSIFLRLGIIKRSVEE